MAKIFDIKGLAERIEARLKETGQTPRAASLEAVGNADAIRNILRAAREDKPYSPKTSTLVSLATQLQTTPEWLIEGDMPAIEKRPMSGFRPPPKFIADTSARVYSSAEGGEGALILSPEPIEYQRPPATLEGVDEAFGILFTGESMIPAVRPGQIGWVDPRLPAMGGEEHVLFSSRPDLGEERAMVKDLVSWTKTKWKVHQWNPERTFELDRREWQRAYRIVAKFNRR